MGKEDIKYQTGFDNEFSTEALPGALPVGQNSPQKVAYGLYAEQLSGSAFTQPGKENQISWLYRILPSVKQSSFKPHTQKSWKSAPFEKSQPTSPEQLRWDPMPYAKTKKDFFESMFSVCGCGDVSANVGSSVHLYAFNDCMVAKKKFLVNADGDLLFVPQEGAIFLRTEFGNLHVAPGEIAVVQRGMRFAVGLDVSQARGYVLENYGAHFQLPYRGVIGANGLANPRDFLYPVAQFEESSDDFQLIQKFCGNFFEAELDHSPFDVVAWHGNYAPFKYDLKNFNTINTVSFDHPDPSIFTVLTSPSGRPGVANVDFVIFPPRWMVAENTFRPPYFHRNIMNEYMGLIFGVYDAKPAGGFVPGGGSLHNCMSAHGPEEAAFTKASQSKLAPEKLENTLAFMFETNLVYQPTDQSLSAPFLQKNYSQCWQGLKANFHKEKN